MTHIITGRPIADMQSILIDAVEMAGGQRAWSRKSGISQTEISLVINNKRPLSEPMINALGFVTQTVCIPMRGQNR